jgi:transposase
VAASPGPSISRRARAHTTRAQLPDAATKIVFDKFHIAKHLNEGVDRVRRAEHRELRAQGDDRLRGTKYTWLRHPAHFTAETWREFGALRTSTLKVARAWPRTKGMSSCRQRASTT